MIVPSGDLISAANFLRTSYRGPELLIGHSLGGTAILVAAHSIGEATCIATIGSPADPDHVSQQFHCDVEKIESDGEAEVNLAGRKFTIKKQFLQDIRDAIGAEHIAKLKKALLVFHSPIDQMVSIRQAEMIYSAAKHPKSFVSLDNADHLLTKKEDANYVADLIASWANRYIS
ncbi:MAG: fermentation-respiration switch protein FrsA (DUF1100 family) [Pseudohongiellaceae bacterium]